MKAKVKAKKKAFPRHKKSNTPDTTNHSYNVGNDWWNMRSKHGRDKIFKSPEIMWEAACEYFQYIRDNPLYEAQKNAAGGFTNVPKMRPFTLMGLCLYLDVNTAYFRVFKSQERKDGDAFNTVIAKIEETVHTQQFEGAASGFLHANIISRSLGLVDRNDVTSGDKPLPTPTINIIQGPKFANDEGQITE